MKEHKTPSDQFNRLKEEVKKTLLMVEEIDKGVAIVDQLEAREMKMYLARARKNFEMGGFWLDKAIKFATRR